MKSKYIVYPVKFEKEEYEHIKQLIKQYNELIHGDKIKSIHELIKKAVKIYAERMEITIYAKLTAQMIIEKNKKLQR